MPIYMHIEGIEGDVTAKGHEKWIELNSLTFGVNRDIKTRNGKASDREKTLPNVGEIIVGMNMSKSSPNIFNEACVGKAKKTIEIDVCQTTTGEPKTYLRYTLSEVLLSNYQVHIDHDAERAEPLEKINLNFNKIVMKYTQFSDGNTPLAPTAAGYDLTTGTKV